jgi:CTP:molybdopterin cytidylyltransferase MocA
METLSSHVRNNDIGTPLFRHDFVMELAAVLDARARSGAYCGVPDPATIPVLAVVLAAGGGSRFRGAEHKLRTVVGGMTLAERSISTAIAAAIGPVLVVTGAVELTIPDGATTVHNERWRDGQSTSLRLAVAEADRLGAEAIVVGLADQPSVEPDAWRLVAEARSPIAIATYDGERRNPVRLERSVWPLLPTAGDEGARSLARLRPDLVQEVPCPGSGDDIDTLEELRTWQSRSSTSSP